MSVSSGIKPNMSSVLLCAAAKLPSGVMVASGVIYTAAGHVIFFGNSNMSLYARGKVLRSLTDSAFLRKAFLSTDRRHVQGCLNI